MIREAVVDVLRPYHFRGKLRLLAGVAPSRGERDADVFGYRMKLDLAEAIQRWIWLGAFEPQETALVRSWLRPGMTFVDVGANVGYFSLLAASLVGERGRVYALEPSPYAYARIAATLRTNRMPQAEAFQMGLSDAPGELTLYLPPAAANFHSPTMSASSGGEPVSVPVRRMDDVLDEWGVETVDLVKVDVEGHEPRVFEGASRVLATGRIRAVLVEFNDFWLRDAGSTPDALYRTLLDAGFVDTAGPAAFAPDCVVTRFLVHRTAGAA
ncbi:MAG: FkbM family methyltransferase [Gemmatimonadota bacterium]